MIKCFMKLVFEKAASEEIFCPLYAKLISELSIAYPILLSEMENLYTQYLQIFDFFFVIAFLFGSHKPPF